MKKMKWIKKGIGVLIALNIVLSSAPIPTSATTDNLCEHHPVHTDECGYVAASENHTLTYTQYGDVGSYLITPQGLTADNYEFLFEGGTLAVNAKEVSDPIVTLDQTSYQYDGNVKEPKVISIVVDGVTLTEGTDYTISYENNVYVGEKATVVINFMGNYDGTYRKWFTITQEPDTTEFDGEWVTIPKG